MPYFGWDTEDKIHEYFRKKVPELHKGIKRIPGLYDDLQRLFGSRKLFWGDGEVELTTKAMVGCLQLEIEEIGEHILERIETLEERLVDIEEKYRIVKDNEIKWQFLAMEKDNIIFINGLNETARIRMDIVKNISERHSFDGTLNEKGKYIHYIKGKNTIAKIPKSLITLLSTGHIELPILE